MKRIITIVATAALASSLLAGAAEARGGGGHMGGFGGGAHFGGFGGGAHIGGAGGDHLGGFGAGHAGANGLGLHQHALHNFGRYRPGYGYYGYSDCYDLYLHPERPRPLSCS